MCNQLIDKLTEYSINPTPHRLEIAEKLLAAPRHVSADHLMEELRDCGSAVSRATVYNTLNLFSDKGLIGTRYVDPERVIYDSKTVPHHHCLDIETGELTDIPLDSIEIVSLPAVPEGYELEAVEVVLKVRRSS